MKGINIETGIESVAAKIHSDGSPAYACVGDVRDTESPCEFLVATNATHGLLDIIVPAAGCDGASTPAATLDPARWKTVPETDLTSVFLSIHAVPPGMVAGGGGGRWLASLRTPHPGSPTLTLDITGGMTL
ncbi:MAG: SDR family NAD(P)-dependent oxidoreductase [Cryobacterium sp.]|nr:SDR family NAD(P)-dependent oxidoreductase [Cryobacterium sp.]